MITDVAIVEQVSKPEASLYHEEHYNFEESLKKYLGTMSEAQIKNQVQQVLNYSDNITGRTEYDLASLVANFCIILSEYTDSSEFKASMNRSLECLVDFDILGRLDELKAGDNNSFLQVPVFATGHLFGCVIYRMDDNNFEFVLVNKGYRSKLNGDGYHDTCEAYMVPRSNLRYIVDNCLTQFEGKGVLDTEEVYDAFEKKGVSIVDTGFNKDSGYLLYSDIELVNQKKGNCFYKNEEAALLFAWNNAMEENNFNKGKSPLSTADLHVKYVENIRNIVNENWYNYTRKEELLKFLDEVQDVYLKNKKFREYYENNFFDTAEDRRLNVINIFLGDEIEYLKNLPSNFLEKKLDDSLSMMDLQTLVTHMDVIELSKHKEIFRNVILFSYGLDNLDFYDVPRMGKMYVEFRNKYYNIAKTSLSQLDLQYADLLEIYSYFSGDEEAVKNILQLNKDSTGGNLLMFLITDDREYFDKVKETSPNVGYLINYIIQFEGNLNYNLYRYMNIIDSNLRRNSNDLDLKYNMIELKNLLLSKADREKIEDIYLEEVNKQDRDALTYFNMGTYSWYLERLDEAKENFVKAGEIDNRYKHMYAIFLIEVGEEKEALAQLEGILEEDHDNIEALIKKMQVALNIVYAYEGDGVSNEYYKELVTKAIDDATRSIELLYKSNEGYLYRMLFNKYSYDMNLGIPNARENALDDCRKLYNLGGYKGTAIWNIYELGEIEEAFTKCSEDDMYYLWGVLWDLVYKVEEDKALAEQVEGILKNVINVNNVKYYNSIRDNLEQFIGGGQNVLLNILDDVLKEFFNR